jgi:hypothetical protein
MFVSKMLVSIIISRTQVVHRPFPPAGVQLASIAKPFQCTVHSTCFTMTATTSREPRQSPKGLSCCIVRVRDGRGTRETLCGQCSLKVSIGSGQPRPLRRVAYLHFPSINTPHLHYKCHRNSIKTNANTHKKTLSLRR